MSHALMVIETTFPTKEDADAFSTQLLQEKLAACVHVYAIESQYYWENALQKDTEWVCKIKTIPACLDAVKDYISTHHIYGTPQLIDYPVTASEEYYNWAQSIF